MRLIPLERLGTSFVALATCFGSAALSAQQPIPLAPSDHSVSEVFTLIKGFRVLSSGDALVTDWIEQRLVHVNFVTGSVRGFGRQGGGPEEFRLPGELVAMPGDSTLMVDHGNNRLIVIGPGDQITRTISTNAHGERWAMVPRAVDHRGVFYFAVSPFSVRNGQRVDSVPIAKWGSGFDSVEYVAGALVKTWTPRPSTPSPRMNIPYVIFAKQDGWAVTPDGWTAVVRSEPYRVDWFGPQGQRMQGAPVAYAPIPASMADRRNHVRRFLASSMQSGRGDDGGMGLVSAAAQSDEEIERLSHEATFEDYFPPFDPSRVWSDEEGHIWVVRSGPSGRPTLIDMFDRRGDAVKTYSMAPGRQIIGVSTHAVYATRADADDLLSIERYLVPN